VARRSPATDGGSGGAPGGRRARRFSAARGRSRARRIEHGDADLLVDREQRQARDPRLRDQRAVKRIRVMGRQSRSSRSVPERDVETSEASSIDLACDPIRHLQSAASAPDLNPTRCLTQVGRLRLHDRRSRDRTETVLRDHSGTRLSSSSLSHPRPRSTAESQVGAARRSHHLSTPGPCGSRTAVPFAPDPTVPTSRMAGRCARSGAPPRAARPEELRELGLRFVHVVAGGHRPTSAATHQPDRGRQARGRRWRWTSR
jgi:hypothetical protein